MGLRTKLNLLLLVVGALGAVLFATVSTPYLDKLAGEEVEQNARIMMASATGVRQYTSEEIAPLLVMMASATSVRQYTSEYTSEEIAPLLEEQIRKQFHPQAVSAYAAVKNFDVLHKQFPDYFYREPALNPTNPSDRATDWESDIIQDFRAHPSQSEDIRFRPTLKGLVMNLSRPIKADERCLVCHDTPQKAPASMLARYGPNHGFGWKANEIIGAQIISVPMKLASERAMRIRLLFLGIYFGVLVVLGAVLNVGLALIVTGPVRTMSRIAEDVSLGRSAPEFDGRGSDEIARLGQSFTRMRRSLEQALRMLQPYGD